MSSRRFVLLLLAGTLMAVALFVAVYLIMRSDEAGPDPDFAGRFRLQAPSYYQGASAAPSELAYYLLLNADGTAQFEEERIDTGQVSAIARGTWKRDGEGAIIEINELLGAPISPPEVIRYEYKDGFPVVTDYSAGDTLYNLEQAEFTIGAGERHPLVNELHRRLAAIDWLGFTDPGDDLYTEETRKAVVAFQEAQGLLPNGEVTPATWVLLGNPQPPLAAPQPPPAVALPPAEGGTGELGVPDLDNLPTHTADGKPIVYLTFDDGPSSYTQQMVDLLNQYNSQGTFFMLGQQVEADPNTVRTTAQGGHYIANHSYSHTSFQGLGPEAFMDEVERTRQAILNAAGDLFSLDKDVRYLRPPYGATDANTRQYAANLGYAVVMWDIDPQDWRQPGADVIAGHIIRSVYPGAIVLMHDGGGARTQSVQALEMVLRELSAQGYAFRNVFMP
jgi:peptidoglycan/xylan/chitin deacetylase (PgdA/CDA1 family)